MNFDVAVSTVMAQRSRELDTYRRYETAVERALYKAIRELDRLQAGRRKQEVQAPEPEPEAIPEPKARTATAAASDNETVAAQEIRSVSQFLLTPTIEMELMPPCPPGI